MKPRLQLSRAQVTLLLFSVVIGLLVTLFVSFRSFGLDTGMSVSEMADTIKAATDYQAVAMVNLLVGISTMLLIAELKWDALRVILTVGVALVFGYLMTAFFNLDSANRFITGQFRVEVLSDAEPLTTINYAETIEAEFNDPRADEPLTEVSYRFAAREGDVISVLAFVDDDDSPLDLQVSLLDNQGNLLEQGLDATGEQMRTFRRYLETETDAVIEDFAIPADGFYTIHVQPEPEAADVNDTFTVALLSEAPPPVDFAYNSEPIGATFNDANAPSPLEEVEYRFAGRAGDRVNVLAYAFRSNIEVDVQLSLVAPSGEEIGANNDATEQQVERFAPSLKSTRDAVLEGITLPEDGFYTVHVQPEPLQTATRIEETLKATNEAYDAFLFGPLSRLNRWVTWIRDALTLIMLGLAFIVVFRAEQFSLGADGQLYMGALISGGIGLAFGDLPPAILVPVALLSAATAGFLYGLLPGVLKAYLGANELVSTLMLNTIAQRFYEMVLTFQLKPADAGYIASDWIPPNGLLAPIIDIGGDQITIAVFLLIVMVLGTWLLIQRTPIGYEIRMIGANIKFADYGGVNTKRTIMLVMAIGGALAGLAGAHLAMGVHRKLILNISLALGFEGVVVALLARNNPLVAPFTGLLYAYLRTGAQVMERDANVSSEVVRIIQAVVILLITAEALVTFFRRRQVRRRGTVSLDMGDHTGKLTNIEEGAHG